MNEAALAVAAGGVGALFWAHNRDRRRAIARRQSVFDNCRGLLKDAEKCGDGRGYPELHGQHHEHPVQLALINDTVQLRKLPILWVSVTLQRPLPHWPGALDIMIRPTNTEYYSPHSSLADGLPTPEGWDADAVIRCEDRVRLAPHLDRLTPHVCEFLSDGRGKNMLITPRGVRLIWRVEESRRGHYLAMRQPLYENEQLDRGQMQRLLDIAHGLASDLGKEIH
ncbi:hypothetical protein [Sedimentitalea nanhaiensis]|uniref:DUF3137 domain-containing protein n=1 Tax=Sedimentitalea nanhaiensis TaxID=999627 RepID=A0A1I7C2V5_9RHOB|nr:hypothetical protein [Sedimentitalea nanhaiensis]SFT93777.1 hypothetical protein SAMN05216236_1146 [Sedimentitalea nanhaiensis]